MSIITKACSLIYWLVLKQALVTLSQNIIKLQNKYKTRNETHAPAYPFFFLPEVTVALIQDSWETICFPFFTQYYFEVCSYWVNKYIYFSCQEYKYMYVYIWIHIHIHTNAIHVENMRVTFICFIVFYYISIPQCLISLCRTFRLLLIFPIPIMQQ